MIQKLTIEATGFGLKLVLSEVAKLEARGYSVSASYGGPSGKTVITAERQHGQAAKAQGPDKPAQRKGDEGKA